jgi:REP element-mobilizing transposase RayT
MALGHPISFVRALAIAVPIESDAPRGRVEVRMSDTHSNLCPIKMARSSQLRLDLPKLRTHGGERKGAGRRPSGDRAGVSHHGREDVTKETPIHVTLRVLPHVWNLRSGRSMGAVASALAGMLPWREFRVVHFSTQGDHIHLLVEADDSRALSEGMHGLSVRLAKALNRMMGRRGKVFADRYHSHVLRTPAEVRNALAYLLLNHRSHMLRIGARTEGGTFDRFSSAATFDGWSGDREPSGPTITSPPRSWLLRTGWRRRGLLSCDEMPGVPAPPVRVATPARGR